MMVRSQGCPVALCPGTLYAEVRGGGGKSKTEENRVSGGQLRQGQSTCNRNSPYRAP